MSNFQEALDLTLKNEGGLEDDPLDSGGITKFGISLRFLRDNNIDFNHDNEIDNRDILDLTIQQASSLYKDYFWDKFDLGEIDNQVIANKVFDFSVNMGGAKAIGLLQKALNRHLSIHLCEDGILGPQTLSAVNRASVAVLMPDYRDEAKKFYTDLVNSKPSLRPFLSGWLRRVQQ